MSNQLEAVKQILAGPQIEFVEADNERRQASRLARLQEKASKRLVSAAHAEKAKQALLDFGPTLFETNSNGVLWNVDSVGKILIPVPWGSAGYKIWGMPKTLARCLNYNLRMSDPRGMAVYYDAASMRWYVNFDVARDLASYIKWIDGVGFDAELWQKLRMQWDARGE